MEVRRASFGGGGEEEGSFEPQGDQFSCLDIPYFDTAICWGSGAVNKWPDGLSTNFCKRCGEW